MVRLAETVVPDRVMVGVGLAVTAGLVAATAFGWLGAYGPSGQLEVLAVVTTAASVWLAARNRVANWPVGIVGVVAYGIVFAQARLYANAGLQVVYVALSLGGWWRWTHEHGERVDNAPIRTMAPAQWLVVGAGLVVSTAAMTAWLGAFDGDAAVWDAVLTAGSLVATVQLMAKYIENWLVWAVLDVGYVALFAQRGLYLSAALYAAFVAMVLFGYLDWRAELATQRQSQNGPQPTGRGR